MTYITDVLKEDLESLERLYTETGLREIMPLKNREIILCLFFEYSPKNLKTGNNGILRYEAIIDDRESLDYLCKKSRPRTGIDTETETLTIEWMSNFYIKEKITKEKTFEIIKEAIKQLRLEGYMIRLSYGRDSLPDIKEVNVDEEFKNLMEELGDDPQNP